MDFYFKYRDKDEYKFLGLCKEMFSNLAMTNMGKKVRRRGYFIKTTDKSNSIFNAFREFLMDLKEPTSIYIMINGQEHKVFIEFATVNVAVFFDPYDENEPGRINSFFNSMNVKPFFTHESTGDFIIMIHFLFEDSVK